MTRSSTDVVVIGGGAIGSSVAYYLSKENVRVTLLDKRELASEASRANVGGFCCQVMKDEVMDLACQSAQIYRTLSSELEYDLELAGTQ